VAERPKAESPALLVTCEHGGNQVPEPWSPLFAGSGAVLATHTGYDAGALQLAREMARAFGAPLVASEVTRLLVDLNRSPGHPRLFSPAVLALPEKERQHILEAHYLPHREEVARIVAGNAAGGAATLHVAVHSFTPVLHGQVRRADVGLLYDPARPGEKAFCARWRDTLRGMCPELAVLRNSPYRGACDGLCTWLRKRHPDSSYLGLELEVNQKLLAPPDAWRDLRDRLVRSLKEAMHAHWR